MFRNINCSIQIQGIRGLAKVPSREDYLNYMIHKGKLQNSGEFKNNPEICDAVYADWQARSQVACVFARRMAKDMAKYGIVRKIIEGKIDPANALAAAEKTANFVEQAIGDPKAEGASVVLPGLETNNALVQFCKALGRQRDWKVVVAVNPSDRFDRVYVEIKCNLGRKVLAEALGFGPFQFLPITRRAPVTAIEIRTKRKGASRPKGLFGNPKAHLADMPLPKTEKVSLETNWVNSIKARNAVLGGDDSAARARVTFAIPKKFWVN